MMHPRCQALNTMGDSSSEDKRKGLFREADTDHSGAIDFIEFVHVSGGLVYVPMGRIYDPMGHIYDPMGRIYDPMGRIYDPMGRIYDPMGHVYDPMVRIYGPMGRIYVPMGHIYDPIGTHLCSCLANSQTQRGGPDGRRADAGLVPVDRRDQL